MSGNRIGDTTVFPITTPADDDLLLGTDVSNTSNNAVGETVNFTAGSVADLAADRAWQPYDSVAGNWAADGDGVLYDFATDGAAASAATPASADEYEYTFEVDGIAQSTGTQNLLLRMTYGDDSTGDVALFNSMTSGQTASGRQVVEAYNSIFTTGTLESRRVKSISIIYSGGANFSAGTIKVWRRRAAFVAA